ncbi:hypothetical protein H4R34_001874 [Dimargaris verticillata]|uniref:Uncharacterized protein n=1 Tax=Dimargaris verticillata TaxID=2761393 RepID=A0A9W8B4R3_9FUNG|nr:hypothetical protein H4R34_001874 [Dimargaris verticillata]
MSLPKPQGPLPAQSPTNRQLPGRLPRPRQSSSSLPPPRRRWFQTFGRVLRKPFRWLRGTQYPYISPEMSSSVAQLVYSQHPHRHLWHSELGNGSTAMPQPIEARALPPSTYLHPVQLGLPINPGSNVALYPAHHGPPGQGRPEQFYPGITGPVYASSRPHICRLCQLHREHPQSPDMARDPSYGSPTTTALMRSKTSKANMLRSRGSQCSLKKVTLQDEPSIIMEKLCTPVVNHPTQPRSILKKSSVQFSSNPGSASSTANETGGITADHTAKTASKASESTNPGTNVTSKGQSSPVAPRKPRIVHPASYQAPPLNALSVQANAAHPCPPKALADPHHYSMFEYQPSFQDPPGLPYASTVWNWERRQYLDMTHPALNPLSGTFQGPRY